MSSIEERQKKRMRMQKKRRDKARSAMVKDLHLNKKYHQKVVEDKRGTKHNLDKLTHRGLVEAIQEDD